MKGQFEKGKDDAWYLVISNKDDVYKDEFLIKMMFMT